MDWRKLTTFLCSNASLHLSPSSVNRPKPLFHFLPRSIWLEHIKCQEYKIFKNFRTKNRTCRRVSPLFASVWKVRGVWAESLAAGVFLWKCCRQPTLDFDSPTDLGSHSNTLLSFQEGRLLLFVKMMLWISFLNQLPLSELICKTFVRYLDLRNVFGARKIAEEAHQDHHGSEHRVEPQGDWALQPGWSQVHGGCVLRGLPADWRRDGPWVRLLWYLWWTWGQGGGSVRKG